MLNTKNKSSATSPSVHFDWFNFSVEGTKEKTEWIKIDLLFIFLFISGKFNTWKDPFSERKTKTSIQLGTTKKGIRCGRNQW